MGGSANAGRRVTQASPGAAWQPALIIRLPDPGVVVLVGAAGAGKTTLAGRVFRPEEVLSSDTYRELVAGDPADQSATRTAFSILHRDLGRRLSSGLTTVVDATNVTAYARRSIVRRAAAAGVPAIALVLDLPEALVLARNATRPGRVVPDAAVRSQLRDLARSLGRGALETEGFAAIHRLTSPDELDGLTIQREAVRSWPP